MPKYYQGKSKPTNPKKYRGNPTNGDRTGYQRCVRGRFKPTNPKKYLGDVRNIYYRSSYEVKFMNWLDTKDDVKRWASEEIVIPYLSPIDNRIHRYFPDFYVETLNKDGKLEKSIVEIKPSSQTVEPIKKKTKRKSKKASKRFLQEKITWGINEAKWKAAKKFCEKKGLEFKIITEKDLNIQY